MMKPSWQPCAAGLHRLEGLYYVALRIYERQDSSETSEGLTQTHITKNLHCTLWEKLNNFEITAWVLIRGFTCIYFTCTYMHFL